MRLTRRLTVELGIRYEYNSPPINRPRPFSVPNFNAPSNCSPLPVCLFEHAGTHGVPEGTYRPDRNNFAPRIGFAWRPLPSDRLVVRSAYGIFYDALPFNTANLYSLNPPEALVLSYPNDGTKNIQTILDRGPAASAASVFSIQPALRDGYVQQWNINLQYQPGLALVLDLGYVGSKGTRLAGARDLNQAAPGGGNPRPFPAVRSDSLAGVAGVKQLQRFSVPGREAFPGRHEFSSVLYLVEVDR